MRDLLLAAIVIGALPLVLRHPFVGVLLWTWISVMVPHKLAFGFMHDAPVAAVVAAVTLIGLITTRDQIRPVVPAPLLFALMLLVWSCLTTMLAFNPQESFEHLSRFFKILLMLLVTAAVLHSKIHIRWFVWISVLSLGFYGVKGGIYTILTGGGGRVWGPPGGFIEGNNELALALIVAIPLMNYLRLTSPHKWARRGLACMMLLSTIAAVGSQSRGGFLAIVAMGVFMWWRAPSKLPGAVAGVCIALGILAFMPQTWHSRMETITTYQEDGSAMGRIYAWQTAMNIANDRLTGAGFAMYEPAIFYIYSPRESTTGFDPSIARAAHSIYFQVLGEHGYVGLFLFLMVWFTAWRVAARLRRGARGDPDTAWIHHLSSMSQVSLIGFAVGGAFLSLAYFDLPYNVVVTLVLVQRLVAEKAAQPATAPAREQAGEKLGGTFRPPLATRVRQWLATA